LNIDGAVYSLIFPGEVYSLIEHRWCSRRAFRADKKFFYARINAGMEKSSTKNNFQDKEIDTAVKKSSKLIIFFRTKKIKDSRNKCFKPKQDKMMYLSIWSFSEINGSSNSIFSVLLVNHDNLELFHSKF
jgi:hypothetical protein